jgi:hypothetical protein
MPLRIVHRPRQRRIDRAEEQAHRRIPIKQILVALFEAILELYRVTPAATLPPAAAELRDKLETLRNRFAAIEPRQEPPQ